MKVEISVKIDGREVALVKQDVEITQAIEIEEQTERQGGWGQIVGE